MTPVAFTPAEYRQVASQLVELMLHCNKVRNLVSSAYPFKSKMHKALAAAHDHGIFDFKCKLEALAYTEHPKEEFSDGFNRAAFEDYRPSVDLPGCSVSETNLLTMARDRRQQGRKREPLSLDELKVVAKFLGYMATVCGEVVGKVGAMEKTCCPAASNLLAPFLTISHSFLVVAKEERRVIDEQAL